MRPIAAILALLVAVPALAQSPGTINLVGPSTMPGAPQVTPAAINSAVNAALTAKADMANLTNEIARAQAAESGLLPITGGTMQGPLAQTLAAGVTAAGTTQGTATAVCATTVIVTTAAYLSGIIGCNTQPIGMVSWVSNNSNNQFLYYPALGVQLIVPGTTLAANAPVAIDPGGRIPVTFITSSQWYVQ